MHGWVSFGNLAYRSAARRVAGPVPGGVTRECVRWNGLCVRTPRFGLIAKPSLEYAACEEMCDGCRERRAHKKPNPAHSAPTRAQSRKLDEEIGGVSRAVRHVREYC